MALPDGLTGLPQRLLLEDRLHLAIAISSRSQNHALVMMIDQVRFHKCDDSLGRDAEDRVLEAVASCLK